MKHILLGLVVVSTPFFILHQFSSVEEKISERTKELNSVERELYYYKNPIKDTINTAFVSQVIQFYEDAFEVQEALKDRELEMLKEEINYRDRRIEDLKSDLELKEYFDTINKNLRSVKHALSNLSKDDFFSINEKLNELSNQLKNDTVDLVGTQILDAIKGRGKFVLKSKGPKRPRKEVRKVPLFYSNKIRGDTVNNFFKSLIENSEN
ncbi:hypothetical protein [Ekhidna sp.]|uniref:hypothetical protein n=1 Tax=Ekhidna sp. TaxID=2608089 RepID=UPI003C7E9F95